MGMRNTSGFWISGIWEYSIFGYSLFTITKTFTSIQSEYSIIIQSVRLYLLIGDYTGYSLSFTHY